MRKPRLFWQILWLLFFSAFAFAAENESASFDRSMNLYQQQKFSESAKILIPLTKKNPQKTLYWFNLGNCYFMTNQFEDAAKAYKQVITLQGKLTPAAKLYRAKALKQLGQKQEAEALLKELVNENPPVGILAEAQADLETLKGADDLEQQALVLYQKKKYQQAFEKLRMKPESALSKDGRVLLEITLMRQQETTKPYSAYADFSYGTTDNVFLDGKSVEATSSPLSRFSLAADYQFDRRKTWSQKIGYFFDYEDPQKAPTLRVQNHTLQGSLLYRNNDFFSTLSTYVSQQIWGSAPVSTKTGLAFRNSVTYGKYQLGIDTNGFSQKSSKEEYKYLSGSSYSVRPFAGLWRKNIYGELFWLAGYEGSQDIQYSDGSQLPLPQNYQGPGLKLLWEFSYRSSLNLGLTYVQRNFVNPSLPDNKKRSDKETALSLKYTYALLPALVVYGLGEYTANTSSLGADDVRDKNYNVYTVTAGFTWDVFQ